MELDPHTLQQIIRRIEQQMRCPQCGKRVPIDFASVRVAGDNFMILQLRCETCDAFIVLHATLQGQTITAGKDGKEKMVNASSTLHLNEDEIVQLREGLQQSGGSFETLFKTYGKSTTTTTTDAPVADDASPDSGSGPTRGPLIA